MSDLLRPILVYILLNHDYIWVLVLIFIAVTKLMRLKREHFKSAEGWRIILSLSSIYASLFNTSDENHSASAGLCRDSAEFSNWLETCSNLEDLKLLETDFLL